MLQRSTARGGLGMGDVLAAYRRETLGEETPTQTKGEPKDWTSVAPSKG